MQTKARNRMVAGFAQEKRRKNEKKVLFHTYTLSIPGNYEEKKCIIIKSV